MNEQEEFWSGEFGDAYTERNVDGQLFVSKKMLFQRILANAILFDEKNGKVIELGANVGLNLRAVHAFGTPYQNMTAVEINKSACDALHKLGVNVVNGSIFDKFGKFDLVITSGLLIHISPDRIHDAYAVIDGSLNEGGYVIMVEYFADKPTEVEYRGNKSVLWKRNFGKEFLSLYDSYTLDDYGFVADIDPSMPLDNVTWWLLRKIVKEKI